MAKRAAKAKTDEAAANAAHAETTRPATAGTTPAVTTPGAAKPMTPAQAGRITGQLLGHLKNVQVAFLRFAKLLVRVRDEKIYEVLKHEDIFSYAAEHLDLSQTSVYRYLQVHDWVKANHPKWLEKRPKGRIPDLVDILDLMQIEKSLKDPRLSDEKRKTLTALRKKALKGKLRTGELADVRKGRRAKPSSASRMLKFLFAARKEGKKDKATPADAMELLEKLIGMLENYSVQHVAGLGTRSRWANELLGPVLS
jgi:hypothetical protein